ncbi:MAG: caspase family protein [Phormidesmis sp.]
MPDSTSQFEHSYALVVGINAYEHGIEPLNNAVNDAEAIANLLEAQHGYTVWRLFDQDASHSAIQHYLKTHLPQQIQAGDRLLFYFSGHGIQLNQSDGPEGYLIPQTAHLGQSDTYLPMHEVSQDLNKLPCKHLLAVLDCCFAGSFRWSSQQRKAKIIGNAPLYKEKYDRFIRDNAWQVLTSAAHDQLAYDAFDLKNDRGQDKTQPQNSPFATTLLKALAGAADMSPPAKYPGDTPGDGVTTATEIYQYLRDTIEPPTDARGTPQTPELCPFGKHGKGEYIFLIPGHHLTLPSAPSLDRSSNPYKGLASFDEKDRDRYFGRKEISQTLHEFFQQHQLTIVLGPSGSGKSSLVKAGLLPLLRQGKKSESQEANSQKANSQKANAQKANTQKSNVQKANVQKANVQWTILPPFRPGSSPFEALNQVLEKLNLPLVRPKSTDSELALSNASSTQHLLPEVGLKQWFEQNPEPLVVVIDQFEELITRCEDEERHQFLETLAIALKTYPKKLRAIITLRSDFESQFQDSSLGSLWQASRFQVTALSRQELRQVIEEPAAQCVLFFDPPELVDRLMDEIINMPGGLPLLSFALSELYLSYLHRQEVASKQDTAIERAIAQEDYSALGGVTLALIQRAEAEYQQLVSKDAAYAQTIQQVMLRMVALGTGELARRPLLASERQFVEPEQSRVQRVIDRFLEARLLVSGKTTDGEPFVEPAHDALVRGWPRLSQWLKQKEIQETVLLIRSLTPVSEQWANSKQTKASQGLLWKDNPRLPQALEVLCGTSYQTSNRNFVRWLWRSSIAKLPFNRKSFWGLLNRGVWLNIKEEQFLKDSLDRKYRSRLRGYSLTAAVIAALVGLLVVVEIARTRTARAEKISSIQEQSARVLNWLSTAKATEGIALAVHALQESMAYSDVQLNADRVLVAAVQNAREQNRLYDHEGGVRAVAYSPNNQYIASGSTDNTIKIWNAKTGQLVKTLPVADQWIYAVAFSPDGQRMVSAGKDKALRIWDVNTGQQVGQDFTGHTGEVRAVTFSPDGSKLVSGSDDKTIRIWDVNSGKTLAEKTHWGAVWAVAFSPDGNLIASGSTDRTIRLWKAETGELIGESIKGHQGSIFSLAFSTDSTRLVSGSSDRTLRLWNTKTREQIGESLRGHEDKVYTVKFSPDNRYIISAGADRSIRLWDAKRGRLSGQILDAHKDLIWSLDISPDSNQIASGGSDQSVRVWDIQANLPTGQPWISNHERSILSIALSADDKYLVSADEAGKINLWDMQSKQQRIVALGAHKGPVYSVVAHPKNQQIVSAGTDGTLRIWDIEKEAEIRQRKGHGGAAIYAVAFSPDGNTLVSGGRDNHLQLWDATNGEPLGQPLTGHSSYVYAVAFSPDGNTFVSGSRDDKLILWDVKTRQPIQILEGHTDDVWSVIFSPDGEKIASGSKDRTIIIWDSQTGKQLKQLRGHDNTVWSVQFSPNNNNLLASSSYDRTVRLWDIRDIEQAQQIGPPLLGHTGSVWSVVFTSNGAKVFSAGSDLTLRKWPTDFQKWPSMACDRLKYHSLVRQDEKAIKRSDPESIEIFQQAKSACTRALWEDK